jgi:hypothetical protein
MAKVGFAPTNSEKRKPLKVGDCAIGDIIYIEETRAFALILEQDIKESKVAYLDDGETDYCSNLEYCRKFVGEINFDVNDFEEFL